MTIEGDLAVLLIVGLGATLWWVNASIARVEQWIEEKERHG